MEDQREVLQIGIVGCGRIARHHLGFISAMKSAEIAGLADNDFGNARRLGDSYGIKNVHGSLEELLDSTPLDILHILTPPSSHYLQAVAAIERGIHVLIEKPVTLSTSETEDLYRRADRKGVLVCPDFIQLFHPLFQEARMMVDSGRLGRVVHIESRLSVDLSIITELSETTGLHWSYKLPGGVLHNYITHPLYLALSWLGMPKRVTVSAKSYNTLPQRLTDHIDILLEGEQCSAIVSLSLAVKPEHYYVQVFCEKGSVMVDFDALAIRVIQKNVLPRSVSRVTSNFRQACQLFAWGIRNIFRYMRRRLVPYQGLQILISSFYGSVRNKTDPPVSRDLSLAVSRTEGEVLLNAGKLSIDTRTRPSRQVGITHTEKVLVTGATGYVGIEAVQQLVKSGYYVRAFCRALSHTEQLERLGVELVYGDIRDLDSLTRAANGVDTIVHLAAALRGSREFVLDCSVKGTKNIAEAARVTGVKRVIYMSSMSVCDYVRLRNGDVLTEESPLEEHPELRGVYSLAKRQAEDVALAHLDDQSPAWTILRPSLIVGNGQDIFRPANAVRLGNWLVCLSSPRKQLKLIHLEDVAAAIVQVIQNKPTRGRIFTLSHQDSVVLREYIDECVRPRHRNIRVAYVPYWLSYLVVVTAMAFRKATGKGPSLNTRRLAYLFRSVRAGSDALKQSVRWQPQEHLLKQLVKELR